MADPSCPARKCRRPWTIAHIIAVCGRKWYDTEYRAHRRKLLFDRAAAMFPVAMQYVDSVRQDQRDAALIEEDIARVRDALAGDTYIHMYGPHCRKRGWGEMEGVFFTVRLNPIHLHARKKAVAELNGEERAETRTQRYFTRKCRGKDCRGFVDARTWKCPLCATHICSHCGETEEDKDHECAPDAVETFELLKRDTKPCVSCGEGIYRVDGCDEMFCVSCHTSFNWETGEVLTGERGNPHFLEWQRKLALARGRGDVEECDARAMGEGDRIHDTLLTDPQDRFARYTHASVHAAQELVRPVPREANGDIIMEYVLGERDRASLERVLLSREKARAVLAEHNDVFTAFSAGVRQLLTGYRSGDDVEVLHDLLRDLRNVTDASLTELAARHGIKKRGDDLLNSL